MVSKVTKKVSKKVNATSLPFGVGDGVFIRTVTHHHVGRVVAILPDFIVLKDASWVADDGRFSEALAEGTLNEVERFPDWVCVGRGGIIDVAPWTHSLPQETK